MPNDIKALERGRPVDALDIEFEWQTGLWKQIFDYQVALIQQDVLRALASDRLVVYLSCPVSSRGGSLASTNIDVASATARRLSSEWGDRFWFLNPAQYQLESTQGVALLGQHANQLASKDEPLTFEQLKRDHPPSGGDYMRMWTRVLAEDDGPNHGDRFSAFYFVGPSDYRHFFTGGGQSSASAGVEAYFARKYATDTAFHAYFSPPFVDAQDKQLSDQAAEWARRRKEFLRFYTVRAGAAFSRGSHDEWNIWVALNKLRMADRAGGIGTQLPGFFDGAQVDPAAAKTAIEAGYALPVKQLAPLRAVPAAAAPTESTCRAQAQRSLASRGSPKSR